MSERRLKVAVDARCLNVEHLRGMGKALFELVKRTAASGAVEWHLLGDRPDWPMHAPQVKGCHVSVFETPRISVSFMGTVVASRDERSRLGADLLYSPATSMPWWQPVPSIVTINDVIPWHGQDASWPAGFYRDRLLPSAYHRAKSVITISNTSRRDIVARWPELQERLHVVSLGVDERYLDGDSRCSGRSPFGERVVKEPYLLFLGGADPRKRLMWAIQTWLGLEQAGRHARRLWAGAEGSRKPARVGSSRTSRRAGAGTVRHRIRHAARLHACRGRALPFSLRRLWPARH